MPSDLRLVLGGIKSLVPLRSAPTGTGGTIDPSYCFAVWMRHLHMIAKAGLDPRREAIVEIGPGDSIGTGFAALLTTGESYIALDVVPHAAEVVQSSLFDAMVDLLRSRAPIPDDSQFPYLFPRLDRYDFPDALLPPQVMEASLSQERTRALRDAIATMTSEQSSQRIRYVCPWSERSVRPGSADLVFSQAALQEIDSRGSDNGLRRAFRLMASWLKPGGLISHQIDLGMYGATPWDRQWKYSDTTWAIIKGHRSNYINREPLSTYEGLCRAFGFEIALLDIVHENPVTPTHKLAHRFQSLSERDRTARAVHIVAVKQG